MGDFVKKKKKKIKPSLSELRRNREGDSQNLATLYMIFCLCYSSNGEQSPRTGLWRQGRVRRTGCPRRGGKLPPSPFPAGLKAQGDQRLIFPAAADLYFPACFSFF